MVGMLNKVHIPASDAAQLRVLDVLRAGERTWYELQALTDFNNDYLGILLGELLGRRLVLTGYREDVRVYWLPRS
jgi:hypothetical protein